MKRQAVDNLREIAGQQPGRTAPILVVDARWLIEHIDQLEALLKESPAPKKVEHESARRIWEVWTAGRLGEGSAPKKAVPLAAIHTAHCEQRMLFGDGQCECGSTVPAFTTRPALRVVPVP